MSPVPTEPGIATELGLSGDEGLARRAGTISAFTMLSRVLGLVREQLFAALLGATMFADAFVVAFRVPNLLRDLLAEGALSQAFVPTFKASLKRDGVAAAYRLGNRVAGMVLAVVGALTLLAALAAPAIVRALAGDFAAVAGKLDLTVELTRIMLPFLAVVSLAAVAMGMLNAQHRYAVPALAPSLFNLVCVAVGLGLFAAGLGGAGAAVGWAIGTLLGGAAQLAVQLPTLWRGGWRPRLGLDLALRDPEVRRVARLMLPAVAGLAAVQVNVVINTIFAAQEQGAVAWLNYAFRFLQLPIGVFGVAIGTVATTRYADAAADRDRARMADQLGEALRLLTFLTVPATVGLVLLGQPIVALIYQHGAFGARDTAATAAALDLYSVGLVAYAGVKVIAPAFYAVDLARVPMISSALSVASNLALSLALHPRYGFRVLALGTALAAALNAGQLYLAFDRRIARVDHRALARHLVRVGAAASAMGLAVWAARAGLARLPLSTGLATRAAAALAPVLLGVAVYGGAAYVLGIDELSHYVRRWSRGGAPRR